jgi:DNA-binding transcriptional MerR regulator/ElaB/YqjD/DUF883 family membrane-anchored ribosome-binding protein
MAAQLNINAILQEAGGLTNQNVQKFATQAAGLLKIIASGGKFATQAMKELDTFFGQMVTRMNDDLNGLADGAMLNFIEQVKQSGVQVKAVTEFLKQMGQQGTEAAANVVRAFAGRFNRAFEGAQELTDQINELAERRRELLKEMKDEKVGSPEWEKLRRELEKVESEFERLKKQAENFISIITGAEGSQDRFDRVGRLLRASFDAALASGLTFTQALRQISPALEDIRKMAEATGMELSGAVAELIALNDWATNNPEVMDGVDALNQLAKALHNQNKMTAGTFNDLANEAAALRDEMLQSGASQEMVWSALQPTLQTLFEMQQRYKFEVDETTQRLLDEAKAAGVVGDQHKNASERMVDGINKVVDRLDRLLTRMGVELPDESEEAGNVASGAMGQIREATVRTNDEIERMIALFGQAGSAAQGAASQAVGAQTDIVYGHSPGGLVDVISHVETASQKYLQLSKDVKTAADEITDAQTIPPFEIPEIPTLEVSIEIDKTNVRKTLDSIIKDAEKTQHTIEDARVKFFDPKDIQDQIRSLNDKLKFAADHPTLKFFDTEKIKAQIAKLEQLLAAFSPTISYEEVHVETGKTIEEIIHAFENVRVKIPKPVIVPPDMPRLEPLDIPVNVDTSEVVRLEQATSSLVDTAYAAASAYAEMGSAAGQATSQAYAGSHAVVYGHSPGGLTDVIEKLNQAIDRYYAFGSAAVDNTEMALEAMLRYRDTLQSIDDLITEETLEGAELQMFRLMRDKAKFIEQFLKDMEGASQDIIDAGLGKIDRLYDLRAGKIREQGREIARETEKIRQDFTVSAKIFEQTLSFMHNGMMRTVSLMTPSPALRAFSPVPFGAAPMQIPLSGFAEGVATKPGEPVVGVFGEKGPEIGGTVEFMQKALVGAMQEVGMGGGGGDIVIDLRGASIGNEEQLLKVLKDRGVPLLMDAQRQGYRGFSATTVRQVKVRTDKSNG